jgi:putative ABC transport system permease protein
MKLLRIGLRNLARNRRRSLFTVCAIAMGFAAVNIFGGFTTYMFRGLHDSFIYAFGNGHLAIFKEGFLQKGALDPLRYQLTADEQDRIRNICEPMDEVIIASPETHLSGLLSNGDVSTVFVGLGRDPVAVETVRTQARSSVGRIRMHDGQPLDSAKPYGIGLSRGLAERMNLAIGDSAILMATTLDGQMNALDAEIVQLFDAPFETLDDKMAYLPLEHALNLLDTTSADRMMVLLKHGAPLQATADNLQKKLADAGLQVEVKTWEQMRVSYTRIRDMFNTIFLFVFLVVFVIVVLSVVNTVSMTVLERTREIGTLRAMGLRRHGIGKLFVAESLFLGLFGCAAGLLLTLTAWALVQWIEPTWIPPNIPKRVAWEIQLVPLRLVGTFAALLALSAVAALIPARRAARMPIIDALGHI